MQGFRTVVIFHGREGAKKSRATQVAERRGCERGKLRGYVEILQVAAKFLVGTQLGNHRFQVVQIDRHL